MKTLVISYFFPPSNFTSATVQAKRIISQKNQVDLLYVDDEGSHDNLCKLTNDFIDSKIKLNFDLNDFSKNKVEKINKFRKAINYIKFDYDRIYSRSWPEYNHFLALEYKLQNPNVFWQAEFSDPIFINIDNSKRKNKLNFDDKYINKINDGITKLQNDLSLISNPVNTFSLAEYLTFIFADEIIFTNQNQRKIMLNSFNENISNIVMSKSIIKAHPTLDKEYYNIKESNIDLDDTCINIAYFGNDYYSRRHFESLFYAYDSLIHEYKDKIKFYFFLSNDDFFKKLIKDLKMNNNIVIKKPIDYLEFLNACDKFDVLLVNDIITNDVFDLNPYLPSKLSDYLGSSSDIWAICERNSILDAIDFKYKSDINDYNSSVETLVEILDDHNLSDENYKVNESYMGNRLTSLNELFEDEYTKNVDLNNRIKSLKKENKQLKNQNNQILSSKSWKLTKLFYKK